MSSTIFATTLHQMLLFALILLVGFGASKLKVIRREFMTGFSQLIVNLMLPALIFSSTYGGATRDAVTQNLPMLGLAAAFYLLASAVTFLLARLLRLKGDRGRVFQLCFIFGNTGFVGFPLVTAVFPEYGLVYMTLFTIVDQFVFWTYGVYLSTAQDEHPTHAGEQTMPAGHDAHLHHFSLRSLVSPNTITMFAAFALALLEVPLPSLLTSAVGTISNATPALCMIYLGALVCFSDWLSVLKRPDLYAGIVVKMVIIPIILARLLVAWGVFPIELVECFVMIAALPTMTVVPIIASKNGHYGDYAAGITVVTLVASIATIPLVMGLGF